MAFGFPAYHSEEFDELDSGVDVRHLVKQAIRSLGWSIREETDEAITVLICTNWLSWGERVVVSFMPGGGLWVTSQCILPTQCLDWGKNKANVRQLIAAIRCQQGDIQD